MTSRRIVLLLALAMIVSALVLHLAGARGYVGTLSGTLPADDVEIAVGLGYVAAWFAAVLVAPILVLAVIFDVACGTLAARHRAWRASRRP